MDVTRQNVNGRIGIENGTRRFGNGISAGGVRVSPGGNDAPRNGNAGREIDHGDRTNAGAAAPNVNGMTPKHNGARRMGNGRPIRALQGFSIRSCGIRRGPDHLLSGGEVIRLTPDATNGWSASPRACGFGIAFHAPTFFELNPLNLN